MTTSEAKPARTDAVKSDGPVLQARQSVLHLGDAGSQPCGERLVRQGRPDHRLDDLMHLVGLCELESRLSYRAQPRLSEGVQLERVPTHSARKKR